MIYMEVDDERLFKLCDEDTLKAVIKWCESEPNDKLALWGLPRVYAEQEHRVNERLLQWATKGG